MRRLLLALKALTTGYKLHLLPLILGWEVYRRVGACVLGYVKARRRFPPYTYRSRHRGSKQWRVLWEVRGGSRCLEERRFVFFLLLGGILSGQGVVAGVEVLEGLLDGGDGDG